MGVNVRKAVPGDAVGIARVHVDSWRTTYKGVMSDEMLANLSVESRENFWRDVLMTHADSNQVYVAETVEGEIVGFVSGGDEREGQADYAGELYAIYLLEAYQGQGIGYRLARVLAEWMRDNGYPSMLVWVLEVNSACRFYEALGGQKIDQKMIDIGGEEHLEIAYGWRDISSILNTTKS